jgi:hypothetical protein
VLKGHQFAVLHHELVMAETGHAVLGILRYCHAKRDISATVLWEAADVDRVSGDNMLLTRRLAADDLGV